MCTLPQTLWKSQTNPNKWKDGSIIKTPWRKRRESVEMVRCYTPPLQLYVDRWRLFFDCIVLYHCHSVWPSLFPFYVGSFFSGLTVVVVVIVFGSVQPFEFETREEKKNTHIISTINLLHERIIQLQYSTHRDREMLSTMATHSHALNKRHTPSTRDSTHTQMRW